MQGKRVTPDLLGWAVGAVAAGLGRRAIARVCAGAPNTVLAWWVEAADHLKAFSPSVLHAVRRPQVPLDELSALLRAVKEGDGSEAAARTRLARSPPWGWGAIAPVSQLRLALDVGDRPLAMAPPVLHQGGQGWAPGGVPLVLTDGGKAYPTAWLAHGGPWGQRPRRQAPEPAPPPRWRPLPGRLDAPGRKTVRRRRLGHGPPRVVCGPRARVHAVWAACGWQSHPACVERLPRTSRQHGAAGGRRVRPRCQGQDGGRPQLALDSVSENVCVPHASVRQALPPPGPPKGTGAATPWWPWPPAMAAGLTARGWTGREVWRYRVPPWPPPAGG